MITLAKTQTRLVQIDALMQEQRERDLAAALDQLSVEQTVVVTLLCFLLHDRPSPPVMDGPRFVRWLRAGLPAAGLPRHVRPERERAQAYAQRVPQAVQTSRIAS